MKEISRYLLALGLLSISLPSASQWNFDQWKLDLGANTGIRQDYLRWSIAGDNNGQNPDILSQLVFRDISGNQVQLRGKLTHPSGWVAKGDISMGWVWSGDNRDSDYQGDNQTLEYSRSTNKIDGNHFYDGQIGFGKPFDWKAFIITPYVGYSFNWQHLRLTDGYQAYSRPDLEPDVPPVGPINSLDSRYKAHWWGPWLGAEAEYESQDKKWRFTLGSRYHILEYYGEAQWNLRADLAKPVSFDHVARGQGIVMHLGVETPARILPGYLHLDIHTTNYWTDKGDVTVYFANGSVGGTQLNEVVWSSFNASFGYRYEF